MDSYEFRPLTGGGLLHGAMKANREGSGVCHWFSTIRLSRIILCILIILVMVPIITHHYLSSVGSENLSESFHTRHKLDLPDDLGSAKAAEIKVRIEEMLRIKISVNNELRDLEAKRQKLQSEISTLGSRIEELKNDAGHKSMELDRIKLSISQAEVAHKEILERNQPELRLPAKFSPEPISRIIPMPNKEDESQCSIYSCIDFSKCSLISNFPVFVYPLLSQGRGHFEERISASLSQTFNYNPHITSNPLEACLFIYVSTGSEDLLEENILKLQHWSGDGRNHIIFHIGLSAGINQTYGRAMIVQPVFNSFYRPGFDLTVPPLLGPPGSDVWYDLPSITPARRRFLLSFSGQSSNHTKVIQSALEQLQGSSTSDEFFFEFQCNIPDSLEMSLCGSTQTRTAVLQQSTFVLIPLPMGNDLTSTIVQLRLYEALKSGAVPIVVGDHNRRFLFPYEDVIDWNRAVIRLPTSRLPELHFYIRAVMDRDILAMRRQGRILWEKYFGSIQSIVDSVVAVYRQRIGIPPPAIMDEPSPSVFSENFTPLKTEAIVQDVNGELDENLGPIEPPFPSPKFQRNLTFTLIHGYDMWNVWSHPFHLFPQTPFDPVMPSEAKFTGSSLGFRPIAGGCGGSGKEFSENLGGNLPREQFTVVMLTYEREQVLIESLARLSGLPYLHKVVVVWNSPRPPSPELRWPEIGVEIHVIRTLKNSLNNRFLPYDVIETEAVLSVDDDAHLRHDEIIFGFRVWREQRDRVVGFPGRFHAWDSLHNNWAYNSNYSCELSMVLTGAAFYHKYYNYLYSLVMPQAIRDKVDEFMNCEDIAMNFLVSHVTRQPPVKVTSRWTFRCPGCPVSLSEDETHFQERHKCINFFAKVYGYMPLLNTQFRVDSVLFKTRIPHDKQKCFKFI